MITITTEQGHVLRFISAPDGLPPFEVSDLGKTLVGLIECGQCGSTAAMICSHSEATTDPDARSEHLIFHLQQATRAFDATACEPVGVEGIDEQIRFPTTDPALRC